MGEVANSMGLQAVVGAIVRTGEADFDLRKTLQALAEAAQAFTGADGVAIESTRDDCLGAPLPAVGKLSGIPRRLPIIAEGTELGFIAIYGAGMFGPATADRTRILADLAAIALARSSRAAAREQPPVDDARYRLISGVSHNLRNTLGAAVGYMQLVGMESSLTAQQEEYVTRSRTAVTAAVTLISDLLELTRADAGKLTFDREPVNLNAVAREAMRKHRDAALAKQCEIDVVAEANPVILTDSSYVQQIVDVLVYNAVRYTPAGGRVTVRVDMRSGRRSSDPDQWACVAVTDSGGGVVEEEQVFEAVHRVEQTRGNVRFRLAICRRVARLLRGDVMLETQKDIGSTFTLWLPAPART